MENRHSERTEVDFPIELSEMEGNSIRGKMINVSLGGACVEFKSVPYLIEERVVTIFIKPPELQLSTRVNSQVVWKSAGGKNGSFRCGVKFLENNRLDLNRINKFLNYCQDKSLEERNKKNLAQGDQVRDLFSKCKDYKRVKNAISRNIYPYFRIFHSGTGRKVKYGKKEVLMFGSNNYLGLSNDKRVIRAMVRTSKKYGIGSGGASLISGTTNYHAELENEIAKFLKREKAIIFTTGYQTNVGTISSLVGRNDAVIFDADAHASLIDGCRLSFGETKKFRHNDVNDFKQTLESISRKGILVVVDGIYSMEGDMVSLPDIVKICKEHEAKILVDEAHAIGIFGKEGRGISEYFFVEKDVDLIVGTFSKSFGALGGFVAGTSEVIDYVKHHARSLLFSTSMEPANASSILKALEIIKKEPERRTTLLRNAERLRKELKNIGFDVGRGQSQIIPIIVGNENIAMQFWTRLFEANIYVGVMIPPAVPNNRSLLRISCSAQHSNEDIDRFLEISKKIGKQLGIIV